MNPNKALWEKGDLTEIAAFMRQSGEAIVKSLDITTPLRVLDLGCGDGTTAVPLARLGALVVGIDIAKNLVDAGNKRAAKAGLNRLTFQEGDACNLQGVGDHTFDFVSLAGIRNRFSLLQFVVVSIDGYCGIARWSFSAVILIGTGMRRATEDQSRDGACQDTGHDAQNS